MKRFAARSCHCRGEAPWPPVVYTRSTKTDSWSWLSFRSVTLPKALNDITTTSEGSEWLRLNIRFPKWNVQVQQLVSFQTIVSMTTGPVCVHICIHIGKGSKSGFSSRSERIESARRDILQHSRKISSTVTLALPKNNPMNVVGTNTVTRQ